MQESTRGRARTSARCALKRRRSSTRWPSAPFFKAAAAVIQHYYGPVETGNGKSAVRDMMESDHQEWLLNTNEGWPLWSARIAHWRYRCEVKAGASPVFTSYLTTWLRELCEWVGFYTGERREQWRGFRQSLEQLRDTGVRPRQGEVRVQGGLSAWWQTHTECFTQERKADKHSWNRETESRPKRPRQAGSGVLIRSARSDCRAGCKELQDCVHLRVIKTTGPQGHAQGRGLWRIRSGR